MYSLSTSIFFNVFKHAKFATQRPPHPHTNNLSERFEIDRMRIIESSMGHKNYRLECQPRARIGTDSRRNSVTVTRFPLRRILSPGVSSQLFVFGISALSIYLSTIYFWIAQPQPAERFSRPASLIGHESADLEIDSVGVRGIQTRSRSSRIAERESLTVPTAALMISWALEREFLPPTRTFFHRRSRYPRRCVYCTPTVVRAEKCLLIRLAISRIVKIMYDYDDSETRRCQ